MPKQKDLKRLIRSRIQKTGEAYTAARLQLLKKREISPDHAAAAGMSDASVRRATGKGWAEWVALLDAAGATRKPHREIARHVSSLGMPNWWSQMVTVGYERIRGLRDRGQRRTGGYSAGKSRTFPVSVARLYRAFASEKERRRWLPVEASVRSATHGERLRMTWEDGSTVVFEFWSKGRLKSAVAAGHENLPDKAAVDAFKKAWTGHFDRLGEMLF
jgi:uncharacterized protein YndB with AHSA1/START domain